MTTDSRDAITVDARLKEAFASLQAESGSGHPSEDDWARFAADELSAAERTQLADHVVSCAECAGIFRVVSLVVADSAVGRSAAERRPSFGDWRLLAAAAAVLLTIGLSVWWAVRPRTSAIQRARLGNGIRPPTEGRDVTRTLEGTPGAGLILAHRRVHHSNWIDDAPGFFDVVHPGKQGGVASEPVRQHALVGERCRDAIELAVERRVVVGGDRVVYSRICLLFNQLTALAKRRPLPECWQ